MALSITAVTDDTSLLDLPWDVPLEDWPADRTVSLPRGISRHVVRFVQLAERVYAIKEVNLLLAEREYRLLRSLGRKREPAVEAVGIVSGRTSTEGDELEPALVTRHLQFSLPYRALFSGPLRPDTAMRLIDALAVLLVRLHLAGFYWGDCSLSNTLFRRDAGAFAAYLVDAETGELHEALTSGQREHDLEVAQTNIAGELLDLQAADFLHDSIDPFDTAQAIADRYRGLWTELTEAQTYGAGERWKVDERLARLNDLGFDVEELKIVSEPDGNRLVVQPKVVDPGHHHRRLLQLTGIDVQENQARRLLNDLDTFRAAMAIDNEGVAATRWVMEVFEPVVRAIPRELRGKLEPAEIFHEILEHRWYLSERAGKDVGLWDAVPSYLATVLRKKPDEKAVIGGGLGSAVTTVQLPSEYSTSDATAGARSLAADTGTLSVFTDEMLDAYEDEHSLGDGVQGPSPRLSPDTGDLPAFNDATLQAHDIVRSSTGRTDETSKLPVMTDDVLDAYEAQQSSR